MEKYFGEKQQRFSFRKLSVGLVSATISSLFFMSVLGSSSVGAQETAGVHYKYVTDSELSSEEKKQLVYDIPTYVENDDETYYLVYKLNSQNQLAELPNTGSKNEMQALVTGASLAALGILIFAVSKKKVKNKTVLHLVLVAGIGNGVLVSAHALENNLLLNYNTDYELISGEKLPLPKDISGYTYIGYIKEEKTTSDSKVSNQEKSVATPTKQQKVDYSVTPNFVEHPSTVQAIQEEKTVSSTKPTEVQVVENPLSTELTNPRKEEKQSSNSQEQLAKHKDVQAGTLVTDKGEPAIQPELPEAVVSDKGEAAVQPALPEAVVSDKGEPAVQPELPEAVVTDKGEPAVQPALPEAVVSDKGEPEVQPALPEAVVTDKGKPEVQPALPEAVISDKGEPEVQPELSAAVVTDKGEPEVHEKPEYTGVQAGAIVEPEKVEPEYAGVQAGAVVEPEKVSPPKEYTGVQAGAIVEPEKVEAPKEYTGVQAGAIVEPEKVEPPKEYTGVQAGAIVEPEKVEAPKEYTGVQAGAIVEPEKVEPPKEYTGKIESPKTEKPKPAVELNNTTENNNVEKNASALLRMNFVKDNKALSGTGSATFIAPNVLLTVAHNFINNSSDNTTGEFRGDKAKNTYEWQSPDGQKGSFTSDDIHFYNQKDYPKGFIYDLAVIKLPESTRRQYANLVENYSKVNVNDKLNVHGYPAGQYTHLKDTTVEMEQKYANNTYGVQYQGGKAGMSGGGIFNSKGEVIGIHQNGAENRSGGLILSPTQLAWIRSIINGKEITPKYDALERHKDEKKDDTKEEKEIVKKLELRNISSVELYSKEGDKYRHVTSLSSVPNISSNYFMKVKSENFKDVMLPVESITNDNKDNREVYKIVARVNNLIQHENDRVLDNYTYYLPKTVSSENGVYTSFKNLVDDMNSNPHGTFRLGATMDAREVELLEGQESYINHEFSGTLIGSNKDKNYAVYNLKKPLFNVLNHANIRDLSIKEANVSSKEDAATIAKEAKNGTNITNVHSSGVIAGERGIGGLVSQVTDSKILNSSYTGRITNTYDTKATYQIGGLVGKLSGARASIDRSVSSIDMATNANQGDQIVGGIAGVVDDRATISNSYVEGNVNNVKHFGKVGGVVGNLWDNSGEVENSGRLSDVLSDVNVTNGNAIVGYDFNGIKAFKTYSNKNNKVVNVVQVDDELVTKDSDVQRGTILESDKVNAKKVELVSKQSTKVEDFNFSSRYVTDYRNLENADSSKEQVYKNIEKLLPFYNRETIVKYGNLVETSSNLYKKELLSVVPMKDKEIISDVNGSKSSINKLLLYYTDNTSETINIQYQSDFSNVAEYSLNGTKLIYTPNTLLRNYKNILDEVLPELNKVEYKSDAIRKVLDISKGISLTELYLDEQFDKTKANIEDSLSKLLSADAAIAENSNSIIDNYVIEKIKNNKEALLLGLTYLERWYNFKYDNASAKDLVMYHLDFFGKSNSSALDNVIELGKSGFNNLLAKNNVITYNVLLAKNYGTESLFKALEGYRKVFLPKTSNNEWFKKQTKAYIVEEKSTIKEVSDKQSIAGSPYSIGVYDRLTSPSWKYQSMVLPLLTLPEKSVFMIANISTIGFGAYDRYRSKEYPKGEKLNKFVEENAQAAAKRFRDHYDYWYKILDNENKEKLFRSIPVYDAFRFGNDEDNKLQEANFETNHPAIKHFFGPAGNNVVHNANGAYATGDAFYYMAYRMLDKSGAVTYTHEMTHNSDREIYLGGYGRRSGLGPEFFAKGLLQAPDHPNDATITINSILKHLKSDSKEGERLQILDPTTRFNSADDLKQYVHNMFDVVYMLEYLEGQSIIQHLSNSEKMTALRKIENVFVKDPDGNNVYATNVVRDLTVEEAKKLRSFNDLIDNNIISSREYASKTYERNGYFTIKLFAPIYAALSNDDGTPGDLMGRRMAYELLAAKGFKDGMVPYISNQFEPDARENNKTISSYGKTKGLVTDKLVLQKLFNGQYHTWSDFKKAMYTERQTKFNKLNKVTFNDTTQPWTSFARKTTSRIEDLQSLMDIAVRQDAEGTHWDNYNPETDSAVHKLKRAIFKAYLDQTDDFRSSIFDNKK